MPQDHPVSTTSTTPAINSAVVGRLSGLIAVSLVAVTCALILWRRISAKFTAANGDLACAVESVKGAVAKGAEPLSDISAKIDGLSAESNRTLARLDSLSEAFEELRRLAAGRRNPKLDTDDFPVVADISAGPDSPIPSGAQEQTFQPMVDADEGSETKDFQLTANFYSPVNADQDSIIAAAIRIQSELESLDPANLGSFAEGLLDSLETAVGTAQLPTLEGLKKLNSSLNEPRTDPYMLRPELWERGVALRTKVELVRTAALDLALAVMCATRIFPSAREAAFDPAEHMRFGSIPCSEPALAGHVATVITPGLRMGSRIVDAAEVYVYEFDPSLSQRRRPTTERANSVRPPIGANVETNDWRGI